MRLRDIIVYGICLVVAASLLVAAALQLGYINSKREQLHLVMDRPENIPPSLAFATVATGAFRGLVVDILWMRADAMKEQKKFFDAKQLAEWITVLQPRFAAVWEFHAWNMAYNISVAIPASQYEQRWRWVRNGYELLRDQAIDKYGLKNIEIYRELSRIFYHKIGAMADDVHKYYKLQLALTMEPLLGSADNNYFDELVAAPVQWSQVISDPNYADFIKVLQSVDESFADENKFAQNYLALRNGAGKFSEAAENLIEDNSDNPVLHRLDVFASAWLLRNEWKLEPEMMRQLNQIYGPIDWNDPNRHLPLDWRHPDSHAIYWAVKGLQVNADTDFEMPQTNTDRIVAHSLQNLFRYGKIFIYDILEEVEDPVLGTTTQYSYDVYLRPDLRMFEPYNTALMAILAKHKDVADEGAYQSLQDGHRNMLINATLSFYQAGHRTQAQKILNELQQLYPREEFKVPLATFARNRLIDELKTMGIMDVTEQVQAMLENSYYLYAVRDDDSAYGTEQIAEEIYNRYQSENTERRVSLPPLTKLKTLALRDFMSDIQFPEYMRKALLDRLQVERPELYKQLFEELETIINQESKQEQNQ